MTDEKGVERQKTCLRCGEAFGCCAGACWCEGVRVSVETLVALRKQYAECLCAKCLRAEAHASAGQEKVKMIMSWSGGKDSAMALYELRKDPGVEVVALLTTISEEYKRVSHHGVREAMMEAQAEAIGVPLAKVFLPSQNSHPCTNAVYQEIMGAAMLGFKEQGVTAVGFGDLFLEDLRAWREKNLAQMGLKGVFPLWKRDTTALAREIMGVGFRAYLSCVEGEVGPGFVGREYDAALLRDLPAGIDPCGEYGEFHTFVFDGPIFRNPVDVKVGQIIVREGRHYADLVPSDGSELELAGAESMPPVH